LFDRSVYFSPISLASTFIFHFPSPHAQFWTYGFFGAIFTATAGWPFGITAWWWFVFAYLGIHREDPAALQFDFHSWWLASISSGLLVGFTLLWSLRLDRLIDTDFLNYRNAKRYLSLEWTVNFLAISCIAAGYYYTKGHFSDGFSTLPLSTARAVGVTLIVVGTLGVLATFAWMFWNNVDRRESTLNAKYILALALGITAQPVAYDYGLLAGLSPWHGAIALAAIVGYWALMILWIGFFSVDVKTGSLNWNGGFLETKIDLHAIDRFHNRGQAIAFLVVGFVAQFVLTLIAWGVDTHFTSPEPTEVAPVVYAIVGTSGGEAIIIALLSYFGRGKSWWPAAPPRMEPINYDRHLE
jgi:hypothetical protein